MRRLICRVLGHKNESMYVKSWLPNGAAYCVGWYCLRCNHVHRIYRS
jgi:hypothetical protein